MALALAESLRDRGVFDPEDIGARYLAWWREGAFDTGSTAGQVFELGVSGLTLDEAASRVDELAGGLTAGCNPAHRSAPLAMLAALEDARLPEAAKAEACLTHRHALAGDVAAAVVALCRALIRGMAWRDTLDVAASDRLAETRAALTDRRAEALSRGGFAPEVLRAAVSFVDTSSSFSAALARARDFAGAANYCPVLVGSLGGARWGRDAIDELELAHHSSVLSRLRSVALDLARGWLASGGDHQSGRE